MPFRFTIIISVMLSLILKPLAFLPLPILHKLGTGLGWLLFYSMPSARLEARKNILQSDLFSGDIESAVKKHFYFLGQSILETPYLWHCSNQKIEQLIKARHGWDAIKTSLDTGKGIIFLTPHMGCFEITSLYFGLTQPISVLYRPPRLQWLERLMISGRERNHINLAPANVKGVRTLMQALKKGEAIGILPDQMPKKGEGEWANFFNKPAYTMTLASKLAVKTGASVIMAFGERLENGKGFVLHLTELQQGQIDTPALLNESIEQQVRMRPEQYFWSYRRFKTSRKIKPPPTN